MKRKKVILITGGAGFIGSHLCDCFIRKDFRVICMDNLITGSKDNIRHLLGEKNFTFCKHDISKRINIKGAIDYILHFASPASPVDYTEFSIQTLKVGSLGTHNVLGVAKAKKAKFLLASTSEVYGDPLVHPQKETYWGNVNSVGPRSMYDESKRFAEAIVMAYHRVHKVDTRIIRIFNTYGPRMRMRDGRVVPNFIYQTLHNKPLTIYGTGKQTRSFCYVDDMVAGIVKLLQSNIHTPVNIGNPIEFNMLELAKVLQKVAKIKKKIVRKPLPVDDPKQRKPDIAIAKTKLKWKPKVQIQEGLARTFAWFKDNA
ncbi:MAG: SDR family oxidoreductase [Candidatus Aceula meridiana]|nr:SDR family oxidoreductase [Candidatus Aceula meridiana]